MPKNVWKWELTSSRRSLLTALDRLLNRSSITSPIKNGCIAQKAGDIKK
jgi:hypothetical protein